MKNRFQFYFTMAGCICLVYFLSLFICLVKVKAASSASSASFVPPVSGPIEYSSCPVNEGTPFNKDVPKTWYTTVWSGRYSGSDPTIRCERTGGHPGLDIRDRYGVENGDLGIYAIGDGVVVKRGPVVGWGNLIVIQHDQVAGYGTVYSIYAHLDSSEDKIKRGKVGKIFVQRGEKIGTMGGSGGVPRHLHFQIDRKWSGKPYWPKYTDNKGRTVPYPSKKTKKCNEIDDCLTDAQRQEAARYVEENTINPMWFVENANNCQQPIYATLWDDGVYKSIDRGKSWTKILERSWVSALLAINNNIFVGVWSTGEMLKSKDGGAKWESINFEQINQFYYDGSILYVATTWDAYRSLDMGETWASLNVRKSVDCILSVNGTIFVASGGLFRSDNEGESWEPCNNGLPFIENVGYWVDNLASFDNKLFAYVPGYGIYRSENGGISWTPASNGLETKFVSSLLVVRDVIFAGSNCEGSVFKSLDGGDNWIPAGNGIQEKISSLISSCFTLYASGLRAGDRGKSLIYESKDELNWEVVYEGFEEMPYLALFSTEY